MEALKAALKKKLLESKSMEVGRPVPDQEYSDGMTEGDAMESRKLQEENDMAPELEGAEAESEHKELGMEQGEQDILKQILAAISDKAPVSGRAPMSLGERAAHGAKEKLKHMSKGKEPAHAKEPIKHLRK